MLNGLTWVHWANSRITEKESNVKNKENGSDRALYSIPASKWVSLTGLGDKAKVGRFHSKMNV